MDRPGMGMEPPQPTQHRRVKGRRDFEFPRQPAENIAILRFEKRFIIGQVRLAEMGDLGIGETAHQQVRLAHPAMPGAE